MLVALAIASALVSLALPKVNALRSAAALERSVVALTALLKADRNAALSDGRTIYTAIDFQAGLVHSGARDKILRLTDRYPSGLAAEANRRPAQETSGFLFFGDGRSSGGRLLVSDGRRRHDIAVNWATAAIVASAQARPEGGE